MLFPVLGICSPTAPHCDLIGHQASRVSVKSVRSWQGCRRPRPNSGRTCFPASSRRVAVSRLPLIRTAPGVPPHAPMLIPKGMPPLPPYFTATTTAVVASSGLLLCLPREMLANPLPPTSTQQMKQAFAPRGRCTGQTMRSLIFSMSHAEERGVGGCW